MQIIFKSLQYNFLLDEPTWRLKIGHHIRLLLQNLHQIYELKYGIDYVENIFQEK